MSVIEPQVRPHDAGQDERPPLVNDFAIVVATVNGSGSQTANNTLIRAIFKMGIPVSGKNLFPSNIAGLPTWYTIRLSKDGYIARREGPEILVAFNPKTADEDLHALPVGGVCVYPDDMKFASLRDDVTYYPLPVKELVKQSGADVKLRDYVANMAYVGALAELLAIDMDEIKAALVRHFKGKAKPIDLNFGDGGGSGGMGARAPAQGRPVPGRADGQDRGHADHRWQQRGGAGRAGRRRQCGRLVPDHTFD